MALIDGLDEYFGWRNKKCLIFPTRHILESSYMKEGKKNIRRSRTEVVLRVCELG
jgi:hypothetical protein